LTRETDPTKTVIVLVGNKSDQSDITAVRTNEATAFANTQNIRFVLVSAKNNTNLENLFLNAAKESLQSRQLLTGNLNSEQDAVDTQAKKKPKRGGCCVFFK
jgi:GTPase SAR1 family protein